MKTLTIFARRPPYLYLLEFNIPFYFDAQPDIRSCYLIRYQQKTLSIIIGDSIDDPFLF